VPKKRPAILTTFYKHAVTVLTLLSYNCEFNPIELAWAKVKSSIDSKMWARDGI
jgi:transposase